MKQICLFILLMIVISDGAAQISGTVQDSKTGKPLADVEVFVNRSTIAGRSDQKGFFQLEDIPTGYHDLVLYKKGYVLYRASMRIQKARAYAITLKLQKEEKPSSLSLSTENDLHLLRDKLLGATTSAACRMINESDVLIRNKIYPPEINMHAPIVIENYSLGYRLITYFYHTSVLQAMDAPMRYEYLPSQGVQESITWGESRQQLFKGSFKHFLISLLENQVKEQGFQMRDVLGNPLLRDSMLATTATPLIYRIKRKDAFEISYQDERNEVISKIHSLSPIDFSEQGNVMNTKLLRVEGAMYQPELVNQLPMDYQYVDENVAEQYNKALGKLYEKVYVHTDKPYYYPGEVIWFKAYLNYNYPLWRDSLSHLLHVELLTPQKKIVLQKELKIDSGFVFNDFILPDTLETGGYFLRAYTNLARNFGDENLFAKLLPILNATDKVDESAIKKSNYLAKGQLTIHTDKKEYKTRELIELTFQLSGPIDTASATHLSVSVTDATQVVPVPPWDSIQHLYPIKQEAIQQIKQLSYPVETGVTFFGQFRNDKGKPERTTINMVQWSPRLFENIESDDKGFFRQTGFHFYDSAIVSFKSEKATDLPYGRFTIHPRSIASTNFLINSYTLPIVKANSTQRLISEYEVPKGDRLLAEVQVKGKRILKDSAVDRSRRSYGYADFRLASKDLNPIYSNLLNAIQGKVPGLIVNVSEAKVFFSRSMGMSVTNQSGPMVMINDVPMGGSSAGEILERIDPNTIETIEFTKRINVLYGAQGANGVISIYTKSGASGDFSVSPNFQRIKISGYSRSRSFRSPNYEDPKADPSIADYRSTIYWNPTLKIDSKTGITKVRFYAADLPGPYHVVVEGVAANGLPIHGEHYFMVESK